MGIITLTTRTISRNYSRLLAATVLLILIRWFVYNNPEEVRQDYELKYNVPHLAFQQYYPESQPQQAVPEKPALKHQEEPSNPKPKAPKKAPGSKEFVVASLVGDDVSWFKEYFPDWKANIYVMDDQKAKLTVAKNKGREATAYLTYMIDNYDDLPDYIVFLHALRYQWHNEDPMYDGVPMLQQLRLERIAEEGYLNMRCSWAIGCPGEIRPSASPADSDDDETTERSKSEAAYATAFKELFPELAVPKIVGVPCGAQFALTRDKVRERPKEDYIRYRQWLWDTPLADSVSGRVLEYSWHMMYGKTPVHCPTAEECFCNTYGLCNLKCPEEGSCEKRYKLPTYASIPFNWPNEGTGRDGWPAFDWWKEDS